MRITADALPIQWKQHQITVVPCHGNAAIITGPIHSRLDQYQIFQLLLMAGPHSLLVIHDLDVQHLESSVGPKPATTFWHSNHHNQLETIWAFEESRVTSCIVFLSINISGSLWNASPRPVLIPVWSIPLSHRKDARAPTWRMSRWHRGPRSASCSARPSPSRKVSKCSSRRREYLEGFNETCSRRPPRRPRSLLLDEVAQPVQPQVRRSCCQAPLPFAGAALSHTLIFSSFRDGFHFIIPTMERNDR